MARLGSLKFDVVHGGNAIPLVSDVAPGPLVANCMSLKKLN